MSIMIIQKNKQKIICISQLEHAKLASKLLIQLEAYQQLQSIQKTALYNATYFHDHGWKPYETNPIYKKNSLIPLDFTEIPASTHIKIWTTSRTLINPQETLTQYLICTHNIYLANIRSNNTDNKKDKQELSLFLNTEKQIQLILKNSLNQSPSTPELDELSHLLKLADWMSLTLCLNKKIPYVSFNTKLNLSNYPKIKCSPSLSKTPSKLKIKTISICSSSQKKEANTLNLTLY